MTSDEMKRALALLTEYSQQKTLLIGDRDKGLLRRFVETMAGEAET